MNNITISITVALQGWERGINGVFMTNKEKTKQNVTDLRLEMQYYKALSIKIDKLMKKQVNLYLKSFGVETSEVLAKASAIDDEINKLLPQFEPLDVFMSKLTTDEKDILIAYFVEDKLIEDICKEKKISNGKYYSLLHSIIEKWCGNEEKNA